MAAGDISINFTHTYAGQEFNEILLKPVFAAPDIMGEFRVMDGITSKRNLTIAGKMAKLIKLSEGCTRTVKGEIEFTDRVIEVVEIDLTPEFCRQDLANTFLEESLKKGSNSYDMSNTDVLNAIMAQLAIGLINDISRVVWFADTASGSGDYDMIDGLWRRFVDNAATIATIDTNQYVTAGVLDADAAIAIFNDMITAQPAVLRSLPKKDKKLRVTPSLIDNFRASLQSGAFGEAQLLLMNGIPTYMYDGIEVIEETAWTENLADADNPMSAELSDHCAALTVRDNIIIGTDTTRPGQDFNIWYEKKDRKMMIDGIFKLGVNYVHSDLVVVAYGVNPS